MLCTVSTVKDSRAGVERFVERNLASGADHMFVMLEQDDDELLDLLRDHPHVTPVRTDEAYWRGAEPANLNVRQTANADLVNTLLVFVPVVEWLVHLDGDECLDLDRGVLAELPEEVRCIRLEPLEAVSSEHRDGDVDRFKRLLDVRDLSLLAALGAIGTPANASYFRGHLSGKHGVRPALDLTMGVHRARTRTGGKVEHAGDARLRLLHYDSWSAEEFVRKWETHLGGGEGAVFRSPKNLVRAAVAAVQRNPRLGPAERQEYLRRIYTRKVEDPAELLEDLGLLVTPLPELHEWTPSPFPPDEAELIGSLLGRLVLAPKDAFVSAEDARAPERLVRSIRAGLGADETALAARLDAGLPSEEEVGRGDAE